MSIRIGSSGKECCQCRKRFQVGESFYSLLLLGDEEALGREDRCQDCWQDFAPPADSAWWLTRRREESRSRVDFESVKALFFQLVNRNDDEVAGLRYVATLLLIRRRICKLIDTVFGPDGEVMRLEFSKGEGKIYQVPVPNIDEEGLERLKDNLKIALTLES